MLNLFVSCLVDNFNHLHTFFSLPRHRPRFFFFLLVAPATNCLTILIRVDFIGCFVSTINLFFLIINLIFPHNQLDFFS